MLSCHQNVKKVHLTLGKKFVPTCQKTCRQDIKKIANMSADSFGHKEKNSKALQKIAL
jgi:hypothetical protein